MLQPLWKENPNPQSHINAIAYDPASQDLQVCYASGDHHAFSEVPPDTYHTLVNSESWGTHMNKVIKPQHKSRKLEDHEIWN